SSCRKFRHPASFSAAYVGPTKRVQGLQRHKEGTMGQAMAALAVETDHRGDREVAEQRLFERYRDDGDLAAREDLLERVLPLARRLARRYAWRREQLEDFVQ